MTVQRVLVALDPNSASFSEAEERECQCLVTHHPLIFQPLTHIRLDQHPGNLLAGAIRRGIALVVAHTNLDVSRHGTNHHLARLLELQQTVPMEVNPMWHGELEYLGMGQVGELPRVVCLREFVGTIREVLGAAKVRLVGNPGRRIRRVALCSGSGGSLVNLAVSLGVDCYVTGTSSTMKPKQPWKPAWLWWMSAISHPSASWSHPWCDTSSRRSRTETWI